MEELKGKTTAKEIKIDIPEEETKEDESIARNGDIIEPEMSSEETQEKDCLNQLQRLQAEFANYKKRVAKEQIFLKELGRSECISAILPVLDDFDRMSENHNNLNDDQAIEGIRLIREKLLKALMQQGLKPVNSLGENFDPNVHEAIASVQTDITTDGEIVEEWQKGYLLNERLLRPAKVKVAKS